MRIALIADTFPPLRTSGAVQLRDLSREFTLQGHQVTVLLPAAGLDRPWRQEEMDGVQVVRLRAPRTKDIGYIHRTLGELIMPFAMLRNLRKSPLSLEKWDGVVWYAPSIFHGPLVSSLKRASSCKSYLIIRDIFPEWAVDMGLMTRGLTYHFFKMIEDYQYSVADVIGVQSPGNREYFNDWVKKPGKSLEVLQNWLGKPAAVRCPIRLEVTALAGRKVFVYAGNMGIAQGIDILLDMADRFQHKTDLGFLFVGRGSDVHRLAEAAKTRGLTNILFFDEIDPDEIPDLYSQCSIGLVALDSRHKTHNIPGKFLTYMQCGLPVLANVNSGNDLATLIRNEKVGQVCESNQVDEFVRIAETLLVQVKTDKELPKRCRQLYEREFSTVQAVRQIVASFSV